MRSYRFFICFFAVITFLLNFSGKAQFNTLQELVHDRYYLIVGAFLAAENAQKLLNQHEALLPGSGLAMHPENTMTYVFAFSTDSRGEALARLEKIRAMEGLSQAWLYRHKSSVVAKANNAIKEDVEKKSDVVFSPSQQHKEEHKETIVTKETLMASNGNYADTTTQSNIIIHAFVQHDSVLSNHPEENVELNLQHDLLKIEQSTSSSFAEPSGLKLNEYSSTPYGETLDLLREHNYDTPVSETEEELTVYFHVHNALTKGLEYMPITIVEGVSEQKLFYLEPHQKHVIRIPKSSLANIQIVGAGKDFKRFTMDFDYFRLNDITSEKGSLITREGSVLKIMVPIYRKKDPSLVADYSVFFQNSSAVFKQQSRFELNSILELLKQNEDLRVVIHGHTNGNSYGDLLKNIHDEFFKVSHQTVKAKGTAKELSEERANAVKRYLIRHGISPNRIETIGWAGERPLYKSMSYFGTFNGRAYVEVIRTDKKSD